MKRIQGAGRLAAVIAATSAALVLPATPAAADDSSYLDAIHEHWMTVHGPEPTEAELLTLGRVACGVIRTGAKPTQAEGAVARTYRDMTNDGMYEINAMWIVGDARRHLCGNNEAL